jgi:predicted dithiol-disulfide oxidoreductase (DUF899 family)
VTQVTVDTVLAPAAELAGKNESCYPNESDAYRTARNALLAEEIELRRHIERVAALRRSLPPGGLVPDGYTFEGENGPATFADLFGDKQTLLAYSLMFGSQRERPCPICTSLLCAWEGTARNVSQLISIVVIARSPIDRLISFKNERGWNHLKIYSDVNGDYTRAYVSGADADVPAVNVFTRRDGAIRHFWSGEMGPSAADPGQDPRGAPDIDPLWTMLDLTPEGRGKDWYPQLEYTPVPLTTIR